ncbi:MAG TPA: colicin V production CvpA [Gammaproteobacteria bacterium]|jgi:membrane protein required for colicin V production|nr:colicin V production CvpA [Gammaproteobacteria bacterium]
MHWVDIVVLVIIALSIIIGLFRGLIREALSLATWILAIWVGLTFADQVAAKLPFSLGSDTVQAVAAFGIIFIIILIIGAIINYLAGQLIDKTGLSGTDRMLGLVFGLLRGCLIIAILVLLASLTNMPNEDWWKDSLTLPYFDDIAAWLKGFLPPSLAEKFN